MHKFIRFELARNLVHAAAVVAVSLLGSTVAQAQFVIITPNLPTIPATPSPSSPGGAQQQLAVTGNQTITFQWAQGGLYATMPQPPVANYFVVCFDTTTCAWPGNWNSAANTIQREEIIAGPLQIRTGRYRYT